MRKLKIVAVLLLFSSAKSQRLSLDTIIENNKTKVENYHNAVKWAAIRNQELDVQEITGKDSEIGFVTTGIIVRLLVATAVVDNYYSFTIKINSKQRMYKISLLNPVIRLEMPNADFSVLSENALKRYMDTSRNFDDLVVRKFNSNMEWDLRSVNQLVNDPDLNPEQKEMLRRIVSAADQYNKSVILNCIKYMETNNN